MLRMDLQFFAHKKGVGSTKNGRDSDMQRADLPYDAAWQRDCRYSARCEPGIRKIRLYSLYLLGQKCQICRKARSW